MTHLVKKQFLFWAINPLFEPRPTGKMTALARTLKLKELGEQRSREEIHADTPCDAQTVFG